MFDPKTDKYPYPEQTDKHYLKIKKNNGVVIDENYPYIDNRRSFRFARFWTRVLLRLIVFPASYVRLGLKIWGKENLKKHRDELDRGVISVCNHVHMWDYIAIMNAVKPYRPNLLVWAPNITGENGAIIRLVGGIPIPESGMAATKAYLKALEKLLDGGWLHVYSEGSMWEYYQPIRPFKHGAAYLACSFDKPILPMAISYRRPSWIRRKVFRQIACFTLSVGEPIYADKTLPQAEQRKELTVRSHEAVCRLAGIDPKENLYPPVFGKSKRVDYYTTEYGRGYKGSW